MILYKRNIRIKLFLLRFFFIVTLLITAISLVLGLKALGYLAVLAFLLSGFVSVTGLTIYKNSLETIPDIAVNDDLLKIERFYFFGLIPVRWRISKDMVEEQVKIIGKFEAEEIIHTDTLMDIILEWFPRPSTFQGIFFKYKISNGDSRHLRVGLTETEYKMIADR